MIEYFLNPESIEALGWTLLHSLWQGAVFAILLVLILIVLRSYTAQSRYVVAVGLLCAFFLTVSATFWQHWQEANNRSELAMQQLKEQPVDDAFMLNKSNDEMALSNAESKNTVPLSSEVLANNKSSWLVAFRDYYERHLPLLVTIWLLGLLFLQLRFLGQLAYVQRLKHYGTQLIPEAWSDKIEELEGKLRIQKKVRYLTSIRIESPMVIGWLKPVVLLPRQLFSSLSETEIYAVLAHEMAHIRREDFIVNLIQTFLCNVFFFHPGVWWMSHRIDDEREHCCDDLAVAATGPATSYAKTLINVSELQLRMQGNPALAMALSGKSKKRERGGFSGRIHRLFMVKNGTGTFREGFATACILITALFLGLIATGSTVSSSESPTLTEVDKTETITEGEFLNNAEFIPGNRRITITKENKEKPFSEVNREVNINELPVADPVDPVAQVSPDDTRVDALVMACKEGDFDFVKTLIKTGIDVNGIGSEGFTPLMMATSYDKAEIVEYLLKQGADVNQSFNGWTALHEAADEGSLNSMQHLLKAGANVNYYWTPDSPTAISMAASEGNLKCLKLLLEHGADINGIGKSIPPLHIAAAEDQRAVLDYLIFKKVNVNKKDAAGRTALMHAAAEGQGHSIQLLIEADADVSVVDLVGVTARDYAEAEDQDWDSNVLNGNKRPEMHQATLDGLIEKVQDMVDKGEDVNTADDYGRTPLHIAAAEGHNIDMAVLIGLGADINVQDSQGRTPLMYAAADGKGDAVALLVSEEANVNIKDVDGMRAYEWAQSGGNPDLANFLGLITEKNTLKDKSRSESESRTNPQNKRSQKKFLKEIQKEVQKENGKRETFHIGTEGVHLKQFDITEKTPELLEAVRNGSVDDSRILLSNGLSANAADETGQTALMVAASTNRLDMAEFLIAEGADVNLSSSSGLTALHYAALENHDQMTRLLLENNANVDATMRYSSTDGNHGTSHLVWEYIGATPLLIAVESQNMEVLSVLINAGANKNHKLIRNEYAVNTNRVTYLSGGEVMGLDLDYLKDVKFKKRDKSWTPYKQALLINEPSILVFFQK